ncbi:hypothetical protein LTR27_012164 [Elasticomyces elasticus]|nr:hypothetical protein LTR27_012164 [Elasticomyces elasticus]
MNKRKVLKDQDPTAKQNALQLAAATLSAAAIVWAVATSSWATKWLYSGGAMLSQLIIYGGVTGAPAFSKTPPWTTLATLNLIYAVTSTSWLQYRVFTAICWPCVVTTFFLVSTPASNLLKTIARRLFTQAHFIKNEIAGFDLPALYLDVGLEGLLTIRGWTFSLSTFTVEVHGIEAAYNLTEKMHVAVYCDNILIRIGRSVDIESIYGVLKRERFRIELGDLAQPIKESNANFESLSHSLGSTNHAIDDNGVVVDSPKKLNTNDALHEPTGPTEAKTTADSKAQSEYDHIRQDIHTSSPVHQCRETTEEQAAPQLEQKTRAATCEKLEKSPSVPHRSKRSIKASTLLDLIPLWVRRLFSRVPFLLRLVLMPVSYLHPTKIASASVSASGLWMADAMREYIYSIWAEDREDIKQLEQTISAWMDDAFFCVDLTSMEVVLQVSARASQDMKMQFDCSNSMLMRIEPSTNKVAPAMSIDGVDATVTIPAFFLPSHEHLVPARPRAKAGLKRNEAFDGLNKSEDWANIGFKVHLSFPAVLDGAMVDFVADLTESGVVLLIEDHEEEDDQSSSTENEAARKIKVGAHRMNRSIKKSMKKAVFRGGKDDHRVARVVNKVVEQLKALHGEVGYSVNIPVPLEPFRGSDTLPTKLLA